MAGKKHKIIIWLPSPMGDAILCIPALRALRQHFNSAEITFFARPFVRELLSGSSFNNAWLDQQSKNPFAVASLLKAHSFTHAVLFKNSFASALAVFLAKIPARTGYAREARSILLTQKLYPPKLPDGRFKPISMIDYYLELASVLGADSDDRTLALDVYPQARQSLEAKLPELAKSKGPIIILVPGGAFGPSKFWPGERFAKTADRLVETYGATVVISVADNPIEKKIAAKISGSSEHELVNLAEMPLTLAELKALFAKAELVISNDTGPRHIAIALRRKVVTLFGPNDPAWTETGYENEIQIIGDAPCAPCQRPKCKMTEHLCMRAITVEMVCQAAQKLLH